MKVKWTTKKNKFPEIKRNCGELDGKAVQVGVLGGGEAAWLAGIHEYGCTITITPRMRAWLHANGLHVKDSTSSIKIPERPFLRNGYEESKEKAVKGAEQVIGEVVSGNMNAMDVLETVGLLLQSGIKDYATDLSSPANHSFTVDRKGSSNPLVDSGSMIGAIQYRVK